MVDTEMLTVSIPLDGKICKDSVRIALKEGPEVLRALGDSEARNLGGCLRTLDTVRGRWNYKANEKVEVSQGLMSRDGWTWIDDSASLVFDREGFLQPRNTQGIDWYVFAHGNNYAQALADYYDVSGHVPLLPKWALGLWWSRWEAYKQADLEGIVEEFEAHGVPLSVCVVDMDWHLPGWTGYTWNKDFFPNPRGFLKGLHDRGVHACLNLHPAEGVAPKEDGYEKMARHMGLDPGSQIPVPFEIANPRFIEGYFKFLHHPLEEDGVDFWWMDWQQGTKTSMPGLDPLWYLNHLHSGDLARDGSKRPMAFSRWGGWGSHRYPVGFSGDSSRTWETLAFEVEITSQSANTGFGWWSHDIGGFCDGFPDDELYVRWVQFGVLSPIFRFHNCGDPTLDYRPWSKGEKYRSASLEALRFRRAIIPYLYTAAYKNHSGGSPPCVPMYYHYPQQEDAYHCPAQYLFGPSLLAAPFTTPAHPETGLAEKVIWLPPGDWYRFDSGAFYKGGRWTAVHGRLDETPLFSRSGSAVPVEVDNITEWIVFPGSGESELYEDNGTDMAYEHGEFRLTKCSQEWVNEKSLQLQFKAEGSYVPKEPMRVRLRGFHAQSLRSDEVEFHREGSDWVSSLLLPGAGKTVICNFEEPPQSISPWTVERFWQLMRTFDLNCHAVRQMKESGLNFAEDLQRIAPYRLEFTPAQLQLLVNEALGCGIYWRRESPELDFVVWWNHGKTPFFTVHLSRCEWLAYHEIVDRGATPGQIHIIPHEQAMRGWKFLANFADLSWLEGGNDKTGRRERDLAGRR